MVGVAYRMTKRNKSPCYNSIVENRYAENNKKLIDFWTLLTIVLSSEAIFFWNPVWGEKYKHWDNVILLFWVSGCINVGNPINCYHFTISQLISNRKYSGLWQLEEHLTVFQSFLKFDLPEHCFRQESNGSVCSRNIYLGETLLNSIWCMIHTFWRPIMSSYSIFLLLPIIFIF